MNGVRISTSKIIAGKCLSGEVIKPNAYLVITYCNLELQGFGVLKPSKNTVIGSNDCNAGADYWFKNALYIKI